MRVTEDVVEVALRFVGGESGLLGDMPTGSSVSMLIVLLVMGNW